MGAVVVVALEATAAVLVVTGAKRAMRDMFSVPWKVDMLLLSGRYRYVVESRYSSQI